MDWLFDNPKALILIAFVAFSILKRIFESKKNTTGEAEPADDPFESWTQTPETQAPSVPPPLVRVNIPPPGRRSIPPPPPLPSSAPDIASLLKRQQDMMDRLQHAKDIKATRATTTGGAAATQGRVSGIGKSTSSTGSGLRGRLRSRSEIRKAIIMREILERPLGLR